MQDNYKVYIMSPSMQNYTKGLQYEDYEVVSGNYFHIILK